ncbi:MAG: META domain-containing protein [Caldilineaceae bacterium]
MTGTEVVTGTGGITGTEIVTGTEVVTGTETLTTTETVSATEVVEAVPGTVWVMTSLNGESALGGWPVITTVGADGSITGSAGCNYYNASYTTEGDTVSVAVPTSTRMICASDAAMAQETAFLNALTKVTTIDEQEARLTLTGPDVEITFVSIDVLGTTSWLVSEFRNEAGEMVTPLADSAITANIDLEAEQISGLNGCENYAGNFTLQNDLVIIDAPVLTPAGTGTLACEPGGDLELQGQAYITALPNARLFALTNDTLQFFDENHELLISYVPAEE